VITGYGRLGTWFGAEHFGVTPDIITFAKAITSGYQPLGGVFVGRAVRGSLESDPTYFLKTGYTYSGHPTACAAGLANLAIMERENLLGEVKRIGARLGDGLRALADDGIVDHVRGDLGVWAAAMKPGHDAMKIRDSMLGLGVITRAIGDHSLTFCPPLVITDGEIDRIIDALATAAAE
jgi:putrescine---pyruvate transaminase